MTGFYLEKLNSWKITLKIVNFSTEIDHSVKKLTVLTVWKVYSVNRWLTVNHSQPYSHLSYMVSTQHEASASTSTRSLVPRAKFLYLETNIFFSKLVRETA